MNSKEFMSGYIATTLDILTEETCMNNLRLHKMKQDVKNIFCTVKLEEKVRMILLINLPKYICNENYINLRSGLDNPCIVLEY